ncbi:hypothetical protein [Archangium sp.]|uniref:hypothetical protein n=1 Tax=Archangium sp. TaxID=1872627 RepID=UPI00286A6AE2|nr:hypothetical protein [Archangium sp.]
MISYDLIGPGPVEVHVSGGLMLPYTPEKREPAKVYDDLETFIEKYATEARRPLKSQWFVETEKPLSWWTTELMKILDENDRLFVCRIFPNSMPDPDKKQDTAYAGAGDMGSEIEWLNSHVG